METMPVDFLRKLMELDFQKNDARIMDAMIIWKVAHSPNGLTFKELEEAFGITNGSVSRSVRRLGEINRNGGAGYGLVDRVKDPQEPRRYLVVLSTRGLKMIRGYLSNGS